MRFKGKLIKFLLILVLFVSLLFSVVLYFYYNLAPLDILRVLTKNTSVIKQENNRVNIALLGIGGGAHEGGNLTDTMQVMSFDLKNGKDVIISLPRDIYLPSLKDRINTAFLVGEGKNPGSGLLLAKAAIEEVVGIPIHYALLIDFSGFVKLIDTLGGVDVVITESFTDTQYPIAGRENDLCDGDAEFACRYETISFTTGTEHMDGNRALKYVRSRHAVGDAGTDFSRGKRQQAVILALKNKLLSKDILTNRTKLNELQTVGATVITTDLSFSEELLLARIFLSKDRSTTQITLTQDDPEKQQKGLLIHPPEWQYDGKWVLIPKAESFSQIHAYIQCGIEVLGQCEKYLE